MVSGSRQGPPRRGTAASLAPVAMYGPGARKPGGASRPGSMIGGLGVGPRADGAQGVGLVRQRQPVAAAPLLFADRQQRVIDPLRGTGLERPDDALAARQQQQAAHQQETVHHRSSLSVGDRGG